MQLKTYFLIVLLTIFITPSYAREDSECRYDPIPAISFIELQSLDLTQRPPGPLTVKGKLSVPVKSYQSRRCYLPKQGLPAVVILHGSNGVDSRGDFYARALNAEGIATLEIDMWEARGVTGVANRPPLPFFTYPDAFAALTYLSSYPGY